MEIKKTIAENHLSRYGRFGDTEMAESKYVTPGKQWHVSEREKSLMERGEGGERIVDALGSGTFNPETGKEEKWFWLAASAALGAYSASKSGSAASSQAEDQANLSQLQIEEANKALSSLSPARQAKADVAVEEFKYGAEKLGMDKRETQKELSSAIKKSGLVTSADITEKKSSVWKMFQHSAKGLMGHFGKALGGIEEWFEGEKSRLEGVKKRAVMQKAAAEKQAESWYLGKNLGF